MFHASETVSDVRVLGVISSETDGVSYVRFRVPFEALADDGFALETLGTSMTLTRTSEGYAPGPTILDGVDVVMFPQMVAAPVLADGHRLEIAAPLCSAARARGIPIVWSVDDHLPDMTALNPAFGTARESAGNQKTIADSCDALIVSTDALGRSLARLGKPVYRIPNAVAPGHWTARPRRATELRIGWSGSSSHLEDLLMVVPALVRLRRKVPFRFVLQGLSEAPLSSVLEAIERDRESFLPEQRERADHVERLCAALDELEWTHVPFVPVRDFFSVLPALDLDIGICPLVDNAFNRHKSANKFYEYAVTETVTVASDVGPYVGEVAPAVENDPESWCAALEELARDPRMRETTLGRQRELVLAEKTIDNTRPDWCRALREILAGKNGAAHA